MQIEKTVEKITLLSHSIINNLTIFFEYAQIISIEIAFGAVTH